MCTGWNAVVRNDLTRWIITYWEMCTGWNSIYKTV